MDSDATLGRIPAALEDDRCSRGWMRAIAKRAVDLALGGTLLLLTLPVFALVAVLIRITSAGPVFYRQRRCGRTGSEFTLLKFRSMVDGAEEMREDLLILNTAEAPLFKIREDPRVSSVGRILRRTSVDELPQLLNVLRGDMSLVGPRPALPSEVRQYDRRQIRRLEVKPGLTGLWQVSGRSLLSFSDAIDLDLRYVDSPSLRADVHILVRTVGAVISREGAW